MGVWRFHGTQISKWFSSPDSETGFDYDGAVYAVVCNNQTYIKRVYREENGLRLVSINPKYKDIFISYEEDPRIVGIIVGNFVPMEG